MLSGRKTGINGTGVEKMERAVEKAVEVESLVRNNDPR